MKDKQFLQWIYDRLKNVHNEDYHLDYMSKLRCIIADMPDDKETPDMLIPDWDELKAIVASLDKGECTVIPKGLSREEMRNFISGKQMNSELLLKAVFNNETSEPLYIGNCSFVDLQSLMIDLETYAHEKSVSNDSVIAKLFADGSGHIEIEDVKMLVSFWIK